MKTNHFAPHSPAWNRPPAISSMRTPSQGGAARLGQFIGEDEHTKLFRNIRPAQRAAILASRWMAESA